MSNNNYYYYTIPFVFRGVVMKKRDLHGNKVVITGAASGIGRGLALAFAKERCTILLADINEAGLNQTCEMVRQSGGNPESIPLRCIETR